MFYDTNISQPAFSENLYSLKDSLCSSMGVNSKQYLVQQTLT